MRIPEMAEVSSLRRHRKTIQALAHGWWFSTIMAEVVVMEQVQLLNEQMLSPLQACGSSRFLVWDTCWAIVLGVRHVVAVDTLGGGKVVCLMINSHFIMNNFLC